MSVVLPPYEEYLKYLPDEGTFIWIKSPKHNIKIGDYAGNVTPRNYLRIKLKGRSYSAQTIAWYLMTGDFKQNIDHIDRNTLNNKWNNLRVVTNSIQKFNRSTFKKSKSGHKGVQYIKQSNKWIARIQQNGKRFFIGSFNSKKEACDAYKITALNLYGEFNV